MTRFQVIGLPFPNACNTSLFGIAIADLLEIIEGMYILEAKARLQVIFNLIDTNSHK